MEKVKENKRIKLKGVKGITLVALIVTIIILLILAGISIATLTGSGLFERARLAEQRSKESQEKEDDILSDYENKISSYTNNSRDELSLKGTELLSEIVVVSTETTTKDRNSDFTLTSSIQNYNYLLITYGTWIKANQEMAGRNTILIPVEELPISNSDTAIHGYIDLQENYGTSYFTVGEIWFKDNTTLHIGHTMSSSSRTHFAIKSIRGIK